MIRRPYYGYAGALLIAGPAMALGLSNSGCTAASNAAANVQAALSGCSEFSGGPSAVAALSIDGDAKAFVTASANLVAVTSTSETAVLNACLGMAADLHITDTWSSMAPSAGEAPDAETKEVCAQVSNTITATLAANASAMCTLVISGGHCVVNETEQVTCESMCTTNTTCQPGNITTLCSPASLTGQCSGTCNAMATCEGSESTQAQCQGACEGDCTGMCGSDPCMARHCKDMCAGTCTGDCTLAANTTINCGASVNCRGGCSVTYTAPECETTVTPPVCNVSQACQSSCKSNAEVTSTCTPPGASLECNASASVTVTAVDEALDAAVEVADSSPLDAAPAPPDSTVASFDASVASLDASVASLDASASTAEASGAVAVSANLQALIGTVKTHMPAIILLVNTQANLFIDATNEVTSTGTTVVDNVTSQGGKALACATTAVSADVSASASMTVSVQASSHVSGACGGPTSS
jgi:hypothetical protein